jgi:hypothetical protein
MSRNKDWLGALTGVAAIIVGAIAVLIGGEPEEASKGAEKVVAHYAENKDEIQISAIMGVVAAALLVFYFGYLRKVLRRAEGENGTLSVVALIGAAIIATGISIDATLSFAIAEAVDDKIDSTAILAMQAIWDNDFMPIALGAIIVLFAAGISIVRHGALPKWLGWVAIALGIVAMTPIGFIGFLGLLVWILITSVLLAVRGAKASTPGAATPESTTTA